MASAVIQTDHEDCLSDRLRQSRGLPNEKGGCVHFKGNTCEVCCGLIPCLSHARTQHMAAILCLLKPGRPPSQSSVTQERPGGPAGPGVAFWLLLLFPAPPAPPSGSSCSSAGQSHGSLSYKVRGFFLKPPLSRGCPSTPL